MDAMMDLRTLWREINKLLEIVEGWNTSESIPEIERDIVLEKLRALYDAVRFADRVPDAKGADCEDSSEGRTPMAESPLPIPVLLQEPEYVPEPEAIVAFEIEAVPEPEYTPEPEPVSEPISEPEIVPEAIPEPETASEPVPEPEMAPESASELEPEPEQVLVAYRTPSQESDADQLPIGYRSPKPAKRSEPDPEILVPVAAPTLFGLDSEESEAEKLRHRHKQRVILSLYGTNPESPAVEPIRQAFAPDNQPSVSTHEEQEPVSAAVEAVGESPDPVVETETQTPAKYSVGEEKPTEEEEDSIFEEISLTPNAVLGDVMKHDVQTLADTFAPRHDGASDLRHAEPITDLRQAIGLNDKFLLIRDLFGGDGAACDEALEMLNGFEDFDDCMIHIAENYDWNPNSDGAKFIMEIIERKFA